MISNYTNLGEDRPFAWNIAPLSVFLYGVEDPRRRPVFGSAKIKRILEERYRESALSAYCAGPPCATSNKAEWREMVGAGLERSIYVFVVRTTVRQDLDLIAKFNALPNRNHFNGAIRNCADFTRDIIDTYFPHSASRDYINDFGMTTPKAVARSFTRYALAHPEARFRVLHFPQLPGTIKRSSEVRSGTEQLYRSKKLLVPMVIFADYELPAVAATYMLTGRFSPEREFEENPTAEAAEIERRIQMAKSENDTARVRQLEAAESSERAQVLGTPKEWKQYREEFKSVVDQALREKVIPGRGDLNGFFKRFDSAGQPFVDRNGALWVLVSSEGRTYKVGVSASNILAPGSDPQAAYELLLARIDDVLKSPAHRRETMLEFKKDWALLQRARTRRGFAAASPSLQAANAWNAAAASSRQD
ncbi:MAG TPA: hypothetical protein VGS20_12610 [Candidatus Acidoferrales bacterium]|nr:hypothetical protein [Candidatus Acidoferrales bacterium]